MALVIRNSVVSGNSSDGTASITSGVAGWIRARVNISNMTLINNYPYALSPISNGAIVSFGNNQILGSGAPSVTIGRQ
ncbi:MAG: hypothetical protein ABSG52_16975 [Terriglobales bacterium]